MAARTRPWSKLPGDQQREVSPTQRINDAKDRWWRRRRPRQDLWSELPGELLGEVYDRIPSPLHRIRFAAVCRSWRASTLSQPQPPVPWLVLSLNTAERLFCPVDGAMLRAPFPSETIGRRLIGSYDGGWIAAASEVGQGDSLVVVNLFSGVEVPISAKQRPTPHRIAKVVFSEAPGSKHCIVAALHGLALCRVGCPNQEWWKSENSSRRYEDIVFCHGKLYGIDGGALFVHEIHMTNHGSPPVVSTTREVRTDQRPTAPPVPFGKSYIVEYKNTLLIVLRDFVPSSCEHIFNVFELVATENACYDYMWAQVTTLDDHALFLSNTCSKAVRVPAGGSSGVERNHIYYNYITLQRKLA